MVPRVSGIEGFHGIILFCLMCYSTHSLSILPIIAAAPQTPPSILPEPFLVSCRIDVDRVSLTASVGCAATVGSSRVRVDGCELDSDPEVLGGVCKSLQI